MSLILLSAAWVTGVYLGTRFELPPVLLLAGFTMLLGYHLAVLLTAP